MRSIDVKLIAPFLVASDIISSDDEVKLKEKSKKSVVKFILQKVKNHNNGELLFKRCLKETSSESQGHQELLSMLYNPEDSNSGRWHYLGNTVMLVGSIKLSIILH